jgi:hypothetical protein
MNDERVPGPVPISQSGGDNSEMYQAARDQTVNKYVIERSAVTSTNVLKVLIDAYKAEMESQSTDSTGQFIEKLNFFMNTIDSEYKTLEQKLEEGGFKADIKVALKLKQQYGKTLQTLKHISSAQKIHAYLLGTIVVNFMGVYDFLQAEKRPDNLFIRALIDKNVVEPIEEMLGGVGNEIELYRMDIQAMIYYLSGNCHINWS